MVISQSVWSSSRWTYERPLSRYKWPVISLITRIFLFPFWWHDRTTVKTINGDCEITKGVGVTSEEESILDGRYGIHNARCQWQSDSVKHRLSLWWRCWSAAYSTREHFVRSGRQNKRGGSKFRAGVTWNCTASQTGTQQPPPLQTLNHAAEDTAHCLYKGIQPTVHNFAEFLAQRHALP
jgi:hypothetical protein